VTLAVGGAGGTALLAARRGRRYVTRVGERRKVRLADGSAVTLNTDSEIRVSFSRDRRDLQLKRGEALFEVARDASRPFVVAAGEASVRAVGTAFNIRLRDRLTEVTVTEGVVAVHDRRSGRSTTAAAKAGHVSAGGGMVVAPGAVASINLDSEALRTRLAWRQGMIELRGETLEQAVAEFNRYSARKLIIGDPRIASIRVGGEFGINESDKFVEALKTGFDVRATSGDSGDIYLVSTT
jgi:transmembrane sensor